MKKGDTLTVRLIATLTIGSQNNPIISKEISFVRYYENGEIDWFTFKGGKTEYRICGNDIYSITGNKRNYLLID